ncbi:MAG: hypothetical protein JOZ38_09490, partial [Candidatus Eremiobacteraeota bacterium]|nr:hypothetical protein [Candidatus Eremiobacteraeota bacterium]
MRVPSRAFMVVATLTLAACGGGGSTPSIPSSNVAQSNSNGGALPSAYANFPSTAPLGVRVYVHLPLRNGDQLDELISQQSDKNSPQ